MIQLLYTVIFVEMGLILAFVFRTPFRKLVILGIDQVKRGRGPVMVKTVACTVAVMLLSSLYGLGTIQKRWIEDSSAITNPTDQVLFAAHMLESTLMGATLFLVLMIDRLHHYMRELRLRRKTMESAQKLKQNRNVKADDELKSLEEEMMMLRDKLKHVECQLQNRGKDLAAAEANAVALRKQSEGFLLEYDRLLEENQNLRSQVQTLDRKLSWSGRKKNP